MRDPARIDRIIGLLRTAWHLSPDQRLGQLVANLLRRDGDGAADIQRVFNAEDDVTEAELSKFIEELAMVAPIDVSTKHEEDRSRWHCMVRIPLGDTVRIIHAYGDSESQAERLAEVEFLRLEATHGPFPAWWTNPCNWRKTK